MKYYCEICIEIPEMKRVPLIWDHSAPGHGIEFCPMCKNVYSAYNCPYIPMDFINVNIEVKK